MKISITYIDGSVETLSNVEYIEETDNFLELQDEDENPVVNISLNQIRKVQYD